MTGNGYDSGRRTDGQLTLDEVQADGGQSRSVDDIVTAMEAVIADGSHASRSHAMLVCTAVLNELEIDSHALSVPEQESSDSGSRMEQIYRVFTMAGQGTWLTPRGVAQSEAIDDPTFKYSTVNSSVPRLYEDGDLRRRERPNGQYEYALPDARRPGHHSIDAESDAHLIARVLDELDEGTAAEVTRQAEALVTQVPLEGAKDVLERLREWGFVDRRYAEPGGDEYVYWLSGPGQRALAAVEEDDEWTGGL